MASTEVRYESEVKKMKTKFVAYLIQNIGEERRKAISVSSDSSSVGILRGLDNRTRDPDDM